MILYLDTSSLVKLYVDEPGSDEIERLVGAASVVTTSTLAYAEARAMLARRRRESLMTSEQTKAAIRQLDEDWKTFVEIPLSPELGRASGLLADAHGLRGADAVHLASVEDLLSRTDDDEVQFWSADERLERAAKRLT